MKTKNIQELYELWKRFEPLPPNIVAILEVYQLTVLGKDLPLSEIDNRCTILENMLQW